MVNKGATIYGNICRGFFLFFFFFFLTSNKDIYSRDYLMQKNIRQREKYNWKDREKREKRDGEETNYTREN